ncbi:MAG TPA: outer membrane beta-barrel protein [Cyclobacteriaceae bacterium]|nr:outer membrane beta-barrel protein [Cyclobacteriaceae bacterium]
MKGINVLMVCMVMGTSVLAQTKTDSVIINVGEKSKVIFAIGDKADLQTLKQYNLQAVVDDLVTKLEQKDSTTLEKPAETYLKPETEETKPADEVTYTQSWRDRDRDDWNDDDWTDRREARMRERDARAYDKEKKYTGRRTYHSFNFDLGTNNFLTPDQKFPNQDNEAYSVRPWGSWYVGVNSIERTRLARKFFVEWGLGVSWYNFKFENDKLRMSKDASTVVFSDDQRDLDFRKSKLTVAHLNVSMVPVLDFGGRSRKAMIFNGYSNGHSFRIGVGPYVGYRIDSYTKLVYKDGDNNRRERDHDSFYLNNLRYGLKLQVGFRGTDLFFNYDMNEMFSDNRGPRLNPISFGITF